jgi:hypothetical protein
MVTPPAFIAATPVGATTKVFFVGVLHYVMQKSGFACTGFPSKK